MKTKQPGVTADGFNLNPTKWGQMGRYLDKTNLAFALAIDFNAMMQGAYGLQRAAGEEDLIGGDEIDEASPTVGDDDLEEDQGQLFACGWSWRDMHIHHYRTQQR